MFLNNFILRLVNRQVRQVRRGLKLSSTQHKRRQNSAISINEKLEKANLEMNKKKALPSVVPIWKNMTVAELAQSLNKSIDHVYEVMIYIPNTNGYDSRNSIIDDLTIIREIVKKSGHRSVLSSKHQEEEVVDVDHLILKPRPVIAADLQKRSPVVTIMGHVDHGKTTLLDSLRNSEIVLGEAGGITQHIGAFRVKYGDNYVTFLDTPGHAAFSALRNRGAKATDMVILVVAADDGVMEQTRESIKMAQEAEVPIIVAINKIDKSNADIDRSKSMLLQEGIQLEDFGGEVQSVCISALKGTNLSDLMDIVLLQAEMMNLRSEYKGRVEGVVIESRVDHGRGKLCSGLVQRGVLKKSSFLVAGTAWAKVRGLFDENGQAMDQASPSIPAQIIGWKNELPMPGETIFEVDSEKLAKEITDYRESLKQNEKMTEDSAAIKAKMDEYMVDYKANLEKKRLLKRRKLRPVGPRTKEAQNLPDSDPTPKLNLIVKADVEGSVEAFLDVLDTYSSQQCRLSVVHYGVGNLTSNDISLATAFNAVVYLYGVGVPPLLKDECKKGDIKLKESRIIYRLVEELKIDIEKLLPKLDKEEEIGVGNVLECFKISEGKGIVFVAGVRCTRGQLVKGQTFKLLRAGETLYDGKITSMRHLKNEVDTIKNGVECGIALDSSVEPANGDTISCYKTIQVEQKCDWDPGF